MNQINISGEVVSNPLFSHRIKGEKFYEFFLSSTRTSGVRDVIRCIISELMLSQVSMGEMIDISGEIRTCNKESHLFIYVFATSIEESNYYDNYAKLRGFVCRKPELRRTGTGRDICDLLIAVNRPYGKSSYIPCISWGRNAYRTALLEVGSEIEIDGRLQSREYVKFLDNGEKETRVAYELSVSELCLWEEYDEHKN